MARAPLQVLVLPYRRVQPNQVEYAIFARVEYACWQFIAGGAEEQETPLDAAKREAYEEAGIQPNNLYTPLDTRASIPVYVFAERYRWGDDLFVIPEYSFGVDVGKADLQISAEHKAYQWVSYAGALTHLTYDSSNTALWELNQKLLGRGPRD